jgi:6-phosphogluconolactonase (cycloisomerase 2 family)
MVALHRFLAGASVAALALLGGPFISAAYAEVGHNNAPASAVFVQTNDPNGNAVVVYQRADDGTLSAAGSYATGGDGAKETGAVVDPLASQGAVAYDATSHLLFVVNAGSDSVSVFAVDGSTLSLRQVISSGGAFPTSITINHDLAYVLDTGNAGTVHGYRIAGGALHAIEGSDRSLGLSNTNPPAFLNSPGQVGVTPDGAHLIVTTKANGTIDVFGVNPDGRLTPPTSNAPAGHVPFAFSFDTSGHLVVVEAGTNSVSTYAIAPGNSLSVVSGPVADGQAAACWIVRARNHFYVANAASATVSTYTVDGSGKVTLEPGVTPTTGGPIDLAASSDGHYLYSENGGAGTIDEFRVEPNGTLTPNGQIAGLAAHVIEGLAAS